MNWNINEINNTLHVTLSVEHAKISGAGTEIFDTEYVINYLHDQGIKFDEMLSEAIVYNYQTQSRCSGTWVFSLPKKKKPTKPVEKKETVSKITNKKTIKK